MSYNSTVPYGLISSVECLNRAALLEKSDDIQAFLSEHVEGMLDFSHDDSADPKEVAYCFEEQWEKKHFRQRSKKNPRVPKETPLPSPYIPTTPSPFPTEPSIRRRTREPISPYKTKLFKPKPTPQKKSVESRQLSKVKALAAGTSVTKTIPQPSSEPPQKKYKPKEGYIYDPQLQPLGKHRKLQKPFDNIGHWLDDKEAMESEADLVTVDRDSKCFLCSLSTCLPQETYFNLNLVSEKELRSRFVGRRRG